MELTSSLTCGEIFIQNNQTIIICNSCKLNFNDCIKFIMHRKNNISCSSKTKSVKLMDKSHHKIADIFESKLHDIRIVCSFCRLGFLYYSLFADHSKECAPKNNNLLICDNSAKVLNTQLLQEKDYTDNKIYHYCDLCNKKCAKKSTLKIHHLVHTSERPFKCEVCEKTYKQLSSLKQHLRQHTGERPYKCPLCDKSFLQSSPLAMHLRIHTGDKPYKCNICNTDFRKKQSLNIHKTVHTDERPHKCKYCGGCFKRSTQLNEHIKIHTGDKRHKCEYCEKCFIRSSHLSRHRKIHTNPPKNKDKLIVLKR